MPKFVETLRDLRQRSFSVIVVDVLDVAPTGDPGQARPVGANGYGVWSARPSCSPSEELGITVVPWDGKGELALPPQRRTRQRAGSGR